MQAVGVAADELGVPALELTGGVALELEGGLLEEDGVTTITELETGGLLEEDCVRTTTELDKGLFEEDGVSTITEEEGGSMIPMLEEDRGTITPPLEDGIRMVPEEDGRTTPEDSGIPALEDRSTPREELSGVTADTGAAAEIVIPSSLLILSILAESAKSVKALMLSWRSSLVERSALDPFPQWKSPRAITGMI